MAVVSSFDQWEKDVFFSAAEEVQQSADVMESLYRTWHHESTSGICSNDLEQLERELQAALGTAKWQLEQFQQAIAVSHEKYPSEENAISRRRQFVSAIENQIKKVEMSVANNLAKEGKPSFTWVKLEEQEKEEFVSFLSSDSLSTTKPDGLTESIVEVPCKKEKDVIIQIEDSDGNQEVVPKCHKASSNGLFRESEAQPRVKLSKNNNLTTNHEESTPKPKNSFSTDSNLKGIPFISQNFTRLSDRNRSCFYRLKENLKSSKLQLHYVPGDRIIQQTSQLSRSIRATFLLLMSIVLISMFYTHLELYISSES